MRRNRKDVRGHLLRVVAASSSNLRDVAYRHLEMYVTHLPNAIEGWPALMTTEMAARYMSIGEDPFLQFASTFDLPCVQIDGLSARWRKQDLDRVIKKLPTASARHLSDPERRIVRLDNAQIEAIADAVAKQIDGQATNSESKLVSISDATAILGVGRSTIYKLINEGALKTKRIGRRTLVPRSDLDRMLAGGPEG